MKYECKFKIHTCKSLYSLRAELLVIIAVRIEPSCWNIIQTFLWHTILQHLVIHPDKVVDPGGLVLSVQFHHLRYGFAIRCWGFVHLKRNLSTHSILVSFGWNVVQPKLVVHTCATRTDNFRRYNHTLNTIRTQKRSINYFLSKELRPLLKHDL